ncbi:MAG: hypothetical protein JSU61_08415 [Fidelibacterota bacterium]|nr:MAG: hypothetical protein JSU61_08415 [Candidatus Neomarinimicrobiota bacterium]
MPLHPALVHFPIALVALAALLQVLVVVLKRIQLTGSVLISLELAALSAVAAALSGTAQEKVVSDLPGIQDSLTLHGMLGNISTWALCVTGLLILLFPPERPSASRAASDGTPCAVRVVAGDRSLRRGTRLSLRRRCGWLMSGSGVASSARRRQACS